MLIGLGRARDVIPGMRDNLLLHAGPPVTWARMAGPMRGAAVGALIFEGKAKSWDEAEALIESGAVEFEPCHHHAAVGPMAGLISPSMMVYVVENQTAGNKAYSGVNEGRGKVLRMGAYSEDVLARMRWLNDVLAPVVDDALKLCGGIDLRSLLGQALHMGDDGHNRLAAASLLFLKSLDPYIVKSAPGVEIASDILKAIGDNPLAVLNPVMAACKTMADAGHNVEGSTIVTVMCRNGTDFGIRVSGLGDRWFTGPAGVVKALYFPGFTERDANPDIGDSTITETAGHRRVRHGIRAGHRDLHRRRRKGRGQHDAGHVRDHLRRAQVLHHAPPGLPRHADRHRHPQGRGEGDSATRQHRRGAREPGIGQVGAGVVTAPMSVFEDALIAYAEEYGY